MSDFYTLEIFGVNDSYWCVEGPDAGEQGVTLSAGATGLWDAPVVTKWLKSAHGQQYQGKAVQRRDLVLPFDVEGDDPDHWHEVDSDFRLAWDYDRQTRLVATTADGSRELAPRLLSEPKSYGEKDPHIWGHSKVVLTVAAQQPYWSGDDATDSWTLPSGTSGQGTVTVSNPGDVDIWPKWIVSAPGTWTLPDYSWIADAAATRTVPLPTLTAGEHTTVDTWGESELLVSVLGTPVWQRFRGNGFLFPIPPHTPPTAVPVSVTGASAGASVQLRCPRWFSRPWGVAR